MSISAINRDTFIGDSHLIRLVNGKDNSQSTRGLFPSFRRQTGNSPDSIRKGLYYLFTIFGIISIALVLGGILGLITVIFGNQVY